MLARLSAILLSIALASPVAGCKGKKDEEKLEPVSAKQTEKPGKKRTTTDPAEQILLLQEAIRIREKKLETATDADAGKIRGELAILRENLKRLQAKFNQADNP